MSILKKIFSVTNSNDKSSKIITLLGCSLKLKNNSIKNLLREQKIETVHAVQRTISTAILHQKTFLPYKNYYRGKDLVIVGAGPTLNKFEPIENSIYIGCNRVFLFNKIHFDYLFTIDKVGIEQYWQDFLEYSGNNCIKFIGDQNLGEHFQIPESYILKFPEGKIRRYKTGMGYLPDKFELDIDTMPLANGSSVALQAVQFALYTNPKRIFIVGVDCTVAQKKHFVGTSYDNSKRNESAKECDDYNILMWQKFKNFAKIYYPETELISVNPIGLKGLFKDVYTKSYIEEHSELKNELKSNLIYLENLK